LIALGRHGEAIQRVKTFLRATDVDAFKIAALLRQVIEIWELDTTRPPGDLILPLLRSALLERRGGEVLVQTRDVRAERVAPPSANERQLEKVFGIEWYRSLTWYRRDFSDVARSRRSSTPTTSHSAPLFSCPARTFIRLSRRPS
jgi:hypothetical protein